MTLALTILLFAGVDWTSRDTSPFAPRHRNANQISIQNCCFSDSGRSLAVILNGSLQPGGEFLSELVVIHRDDNRTVVYSLDASKHPGVSFDSRCLSWLDDGKSLLVVIRDRRESESQTAAHSLARFDLDSNRLTEIAELPSSAFSSPILIPSNDAVVICDHRNRRLFTINLKDGQSKSILEFGDSETVETAIAADGRVFIGITRDIGMNSIRSEIAVLRTSKTLSLVPVTAVGRCAIQGLDLSGDDRWIACLTASIGPGKSKIQLINLSAKSVMEIGATKSIHTMAWQPDHHTLAYVMGMRITTYDVSSHAYLELPKLDSPSILRWEPKSRRLWAVASNDRLFEFDGANWKPQFVLSRDDLRAHPHQRVELRRWL